MKSVIIIPITFVLLIFIGFIGTNANAESNPQIGVKIGQWVKYKIMITTEDYGDMSEFIKPIEMSLNDDFFERIGYQINEVEWIKYTVSDVTGSTVTFERTVKLTSGSETKIKSKQFDLTKFNPEAFFIMPVDLEFGSKFEGAPSYGEITFSSIEDSFLAKGKTNVFTAHDISNKKIRIGVVENTFEIEGSANFEFDKEFGTLTSRYVDFGIINQNTYDSVWVTISIFEVEKSDNLQPTKVPSLINDKNEILEKLSYFFVESADSRYLLTNEFVSFGEPKKTTYDIIRVKDGTELGSLILYGNDLISSVESSTVYSLSKRNLDDANDIHIMIRNDLVPGCCSPLVTHSNLFTKNIDEGNAHSEATFGNVHVNLGWVEVDPTYGIGAFTQEITFLKEKPTMQQQDIGLDEEVSLSLPEQDQESSEPASNGGGCLIATATFGSELAPQVQMLREIRDNSLLETKSGSTFMAGFNQFYYSFSPTIADLERENPIFKEAVKLAITPLITSLSILNYVDIDSEAEVLGYGISLIVLNVGMYFVLPAIVIHRIKNFQD